MRRSHPGLRLPHAAAARRPVPAALPAPFWALQVGGWLAFGAVMTLSRLGTLPLAYMAVTKGVLTALGFTASLALRALYRRLLPITAPLGRVLAVTIAASYGAAVAWTLATHAALAVAAAPALTALTGAPWRLASGGRPFDGAVYNALALLAWSLLYVGARFSRGLVLERERALRAEARLHEARLHALRYQLNPHFLFNALNAVSTLVVERRAAEAEAMLARLGDFLRLTLEGPGGRPGDAASDAAGDGVTAAPAAAAPVTEVPLAAELDLIARYLAIEHVRFGDRLRTDTAVPEALLGGAVPALVLQPLVENAVRYAVAPREGGGRVTITATRAGGDLLVSVCDDGPGPAALPAVGAEAGARRGGQGVGLANTRERLREQYGAPAGGGDRLTLGTAPGGGLCATIRVPWRTLGVAPDGVGGRHPSGPSSPTSLTTPGQPRTAVA
jgi:signal transduction histidine kinase